MEKWIKTHLSKLFNFIKTNCENELDQVAIVFGFASGCLSRSSVITQNQHNCGFSSTLSWEPLYANWIGGHFQIHASPIQSKLKIKIESHFEYRAWLFRPSLYREQKVSSLGFGLIFSNPLTPTSCYLKNLLICFVVVFTANVTF